MFTRNMAQLISVKIISATVIIHICSKPANWPVCELSSPRDDQTKLTDYQLGLSEAFKNPRKQ